MGIFDNWQFDPQTYQNAGNNGGGLIDRLMQLAGVQSQLGPQGSFPQPQQPQPDAPNMVTGSLGSSIPVPTFGVGPDGALPKQTQQERDAGVLPGQLGSDAIPSNAQPVQAQMPAAQQPLQAPAASTIPSFLQPPQHSSGGFGSGMRGAMANAPAGPLGMLMGGIAGAMGMGQGTEQDQKRAALRAQYESLVPTLGPQKAMIAVLNPEAGKALLTDQFGPDEFSVVQTGQDGLGNKTYGKLSKHTGEITPIRQPAGATAPAATGGLGDMSKSGADYLATLQPQDRNIVQGIVEGTLQPPSSFALSKPYWQGMLAAAKQVDPTFDSANWSGRVAGVKDFSAGKSAEMVRSANQTLAHTGELMGAMTALNNGSYPLKNYIGNNVNSQMGDAAQGNFTTAAHAVAEEMSKVFKGSNLSDAEIKQWESNLTPNMSPEQYRGQIKTLRDLLQGSLDALDEKRTNSMGPIAAAKAGPLIKAKGQAVLKQMDDFINGGSTGGNATGAPDPLGIR